MNIMKSGLSVFALAFAIKAFAEQPKEPVELNSSADLKAPSIAAQDVGNKILDELTSAKFWIFNVNGVENAYTFKKLSSTDVRYSGNPKDIDGLIFFEMTGYREGVKLDSQLTTYRPSQYVNAIKLQKFDRNENRPYEFDLGIDSQNRLFGIMKKDNVIYLQKADAIKPPKDPRKNNPAFF